MQTRLFPISDIAQEFAEACVMKDRDFLREMLSEDGVFEIQDESLETVEVGKEAFLSWFFPIMIHQLVLPFHIDRCKGCMRGKPVIIFQDGQFPRKKKWPDYYRTGLLIEEKDDKIIKIMFCFSFCETPNKFFY
jgi:hypothetical protein